MVDCGDVGEEDVNAKVEVEVKVKLLDVIVVVDLVAEEAEEGLELG